MSKNVSNAVAEYPHPLFFGCYPQPGGRTFMWTMSTVIDGREFNVAMGINFPSQLQAVEIGHRMCNMLIQQRAIELDWPKLFDYCEVEGTWRPNPSLPPSRLPGSKAQVH